nr:cytochrome C oxidase subunit IV family protein [Massilia niastensis]
MASFGAVMSGLVPAGMRWPAVVVLAIVQLRVQLVWFLHLGRAQDQRENTVVFLCNAALIAIVVAGSPWVMHNANVNRMPMTVTPEQARMAG